MLGLSLSLVACSEASHRKSITLWHPWGGSELLALKHAIQRYQESHPDVEVQALQVPSDKLQDKYLRSSASNGGPDLLIGPVDWVGKYALSGVLAPLDGVDRAILGRYLPFALGAVRFRGHLYALPESMETLGLYYNKALLSGPPPTTIQQLFVEANSRDYWKGDYLLAYNTQFFFSAGYLFGMGGTLLKPEGRVAVDTEGARHWLRFLHDLKVHPNLAAKSDYGRADALFRDGKAAMTISGPWALGDYRKALGDRLGIAPLPKVDEQHPAAPFVGIKCFMFNPNSAKEAQDRAIAFASFMTSPAIATLMEQEAGHVPAVADVAIPAGDPLQAFATQARWGVPMPPNPEMKEVWAPMDQAIEKVMTDTAPPEQAISEAQAVLAAKVEAVRNQ
jgi:maltose-binding protein MalE